MEKSWSERDLKNNNSRGFHTFTFADASLSKANAKASS